MQLGRGGGLLGAGSITALSTEAVKSPGRRGKPECARRSSKTWKILSKYVMQYHEYVKKVYTACPPTWGLEGFPVFRGSASLDIRQ